MRIVVNDLSAGYGAQMVLHDISLSVEAGEILALIGPNGAGKTTLIRAVSGGIHLSSGSIKVDGEDIANLSPGQRARLISVVPQARQLGGAYSVWQAVMLGRTPYMGWLGRESIADKTAVDAALSQTNLEKFADRPIARLSGGEQQRVLLARALAQSTPILLLDEPTNHLDLRHQSELLDLVKNLIRENKLAVIFAMHDLNFVSAIADRVALLVDGRVTSVGHVKDCLTEEKISNAYQLPIKVIRDGVGAKPLIFPRNLFHDGREEE